ncbi:hypothetical protein Tco_1274399 [Tanacetum coccineum]
MFLLISQRLSATTVTEKGTLLENADLEGIKGDLRVSMAGEQCTTNESSYKLMVAQDGLRENYLDNGVQDSGIFMLKKFEQSRDRVNTIMAVVGGIVGWGGGGASSHMTGNKAYLSDYEDFNGGFVAFGSDPKGGKITGKGKIKTANLDFDDVYFVDELNFKLLDESQVVLRAPRKDDVYSLDLKNIVPSEGTQDSYVAGSSGKDKGPTQEYILLPLQPHRTRIPIEDVAPTAHEKPSESSPKDNDIQDSEDVIDKEGQHQMPEDEQVLHDELEKMVTQELTAKAMDDVSRQAFEEEKRRIASQKKAAQATSTNKLSTDRQSVSTDRQSISTDRPFVSTDRPFVSTDRSSVSTANTPYVSVARTSTDASDTLPNDGIFNGAYDDDKDDYLGDPTQHSNRGKIQKLLQTNKPWRNCSASKLYKVWGRVDLPSGKKEEGIAYDECIFYGTIEEEVYAITSGFVDPALLNKGLKGSNSDYGGASLDRKSTIGGCQFLGRRLISWQCKKQTIVANSTTEAEYVAAANCSTIEGRQDDLVYSLYRMLCEQTDFANDGWEYRVSSDYGLSHTQFNLLCTHFAGKPVTISEASIRSDLLFDDADGIDSLNNQAIFDNIQLMGYEGDLNTLTFNKALFSPQWKFLFHTMNHCISSKSTSWDQIPTNIATANCSSIVVLDIEGSGGNHGGHSSNDASLSGNKDGQEAKERSQTNYHTLQSLDEDKIGKEDFSEEKGGDEGGESSVVLEEKENADEEVSIEALLVLSSQMKVPTREMKRIEGEDESDTKSEGITEAEKKFKQLANDEEMARKEMDEETKDTEKKILKRREVVNEKIQQRYHCLKLEASSRVSKKERVVCELIVEKAQEPDADSDDESLKCLRIITFGSYHS